MPYNPSKLDLPDVLGYTQEIGIDVDGFPQRVESKYKGVQQDVRDATSRGVRGTPAFVIGKSILNGVEFELMNGTQLYSALDKKLKSVMNSQGDDVIVRAQAGSCGWCRTLLGDGLIGGSCRYA